MTAGAPQFHRVCPTPSGSHSALPEQSGGPWVHRPELMQVLLHAQPLRVAPSSEGSEGGAQQVSFRAAVKMAVPGRSPLGSDLAAPLRAPRVHVRPRPHRHCRSSGPSADQAAAASSLPRRSQSVLSICRQRKSASRSGHSRVGCAGCAFLRDRKTNTEQKAEGTPEGRGPRQQPPPPPQELLPSPNFPASVGLRLRAGS